VWPRLHDSDMKPLRILVRGPYPPPFGGIATALATVVPWLVERGHEVVFMSDSLTPAVEHPGPGVTVVRFASRHHWRRLFNPLRMPSNIGRACRLFRLGATVRETLSGVVIADVVDDLIREHGIDAMCVYMVHAGLFLAADARPRPVPVVLTVLGELFEDPVLAAKPRFIRAVLTKADALLSPSHYCADAVKLAGLDPAHVRVHYLGINLQKFHPERRADDVAASLGVRPDQDVILFLARFNDEMGIDAMLACVRRVLPRHPQAVFVFAGAAGPRSADIHRAAADSQGRVIVQENAPMDVLPGLMSISSMLVAPTRRGHPCCGMSIKEAMASGKPVVATRTGGHLEVIDDGVTGHLIACAANGDADQEDFVSRIDTLLADPARRRDMGRAARARAVALFDVVETARILETTLLDARDATVRAPDTPAQRVAS